MIKYDMFSLSIGAVVIRFFLMMAVIIAGVFTGQHWLTILGLPIFLSALLGVNFARPKSAVQPRASQMTVEGQASLKKAS